MKYMFMVMVIYSALVRSHLAGSFGFVRPARGPCTGEFVSNTLDWNRWMLWEEGKPFA